MYRFYALVFAVCSLVAVVFATRSMALSTFLPVQGGTGTSTAPSFGQVLVGNSAGTYTLTATSSLGITSTATFGTSSVSALWPIVWNTGTAVVSWDGLATSSVPTQGHLTYWTGTKNLGSVATSSVSCTSASGVSCSGFTRVGAGGDTISLGSIPNSSLSNSSVSVNGTSISLGSSGTVTAASSTLLADSNVWTALQRLTSASSSQLSVFTKAYFGGSATSTFNSDGSLTMVAPITSTATSYNTFPYASTTALSVSGTAYFPGSGVWNASGNVGIGTTSPNQLFSVGGIANAQTGYYVNNRSVVSAAANYNQFHSAGGAIAFYAGNSNDASNYYYNTIHAFGAINGDKFAYLSSSGLNIGASGLAVNKLDVEGSAAFGTYARTAAPSNGLIVSGNVGIGTTTPGTKLSISGGVSIGANYGVAAPSNGLIVEGSLGVGTTSPFTNLAVVGDIAPTNHFRFGAKTTGTGTHAAIYLETSDYLVIRGGPAGFLFRTSANATLGNFDASGSATTLNINAQATTIPALGLYSSTSDGTSYSDLTFFNSGGTTLGSIYSSGTAGELSITAPTKLLLKSGSGGITGGTTALTVDSSQRVGIGTTTPWRTLSVTGTMAAPSLTAAVATGNAVCQVAGGEIQVNAATSCLVSSKRYKHEIKPLPATLPQVLKLRPVSYKNNSDNQENVGLIAEEVQHVDSRLVSLDMDGLPQTVKYENLTALLIKAIQEQQAQIAALQSQLEHLRGTY